jgi:small-conductance mechanosensitive channel
MAILAIFPRQLAFFRHLTALGGTHLTLLARKKIVFAIIAVLTMVSFAQTPQPPNAQDVIAYLNQSIDWHRQLTVEEQLATDSTDVLFLNDDHQTANQVLRLSFDFAKADSQLLSGQGGAQPVPATGAEPSKYQSLFKTAANTDNEARQTQDELDSDKAKLQTARGAERKKLQSTVDELQGELALVQARAKTLHDILQFVGGAGGKGTGGNLSAQIDQLQHSVPELEAENTKTSNTYNTQASNRIAQPSGILNLIEDLLTLSHKMHSIDQRARATDGLLQTAQQLQAPFMADVTAIAEKGEQLAKQADTSDTGQLEQLRHQLDSLTAQFKQSSGVVLPLGKETVLLDLYKSNLARWRSVVKSQYSTDMRSLLIRALAFGIILIFVIVLAQVWRRAVFRYVHDVRRRYQFLLLRRIILWIAIAITIAFAMATEIGSIATFAGLITAGIAVALQNVILAIAGYFFLIGRYGVRVGDRIQISGVTGDVIDIGLIRLHLMEVGGSGSDRQPTGRVVVFSNAVVFQPSASFYKQIPGTNFVWHEVSLTLSPESDYALAEKRMLGAVEKVYAGYHEHIEAQHRAMEQTLSVAVEVPRPHSRLRLTQSGLEILIRYPVELESATEVDDQIARELLRALEQSPKLKLVGTGSPNIQPVPEEPKAA